MKAGEQVDEEESAISSDLVEITVLSPDALLRAR
jgi:hypothetical protein